MGSSLPPWQQERLEPVLGRVHLGALYRRRRVYVFGAHYTALADKGAVPDTVVVPDHSALVFALVARVDVVAVAESDGGGAQKLRLEPVHRASRIAKHAVDALGKLLVGFQFCRRLPVLALTDGFVLLADNPRFHAFQFVQKVTHIDDQVADNGKIDQRLDPDFLRVIVAQKGCACKLGDAVYHHTAAAA